jgi:tetratricopeptide (TPR) repeat protein
MVAVHGECPADVMSDLLALVRQDEAQGLTGLDELLATYPKDARLQFLRGSLLASRQRYPEALQAMEAAADLAPRFWVARFQLGFLRLTSGDPAGAEAAWAPMAELPADYYLSLFVRGLRYLIRDDFNETIRALSDGVARNLDNPAMNHDMQLIIDTLKRGPEAPRPAEPVSATHLLLQQYAGKTRH